MDRVVSFLIALGTVLTAAGELFRQYNQTKKFIDLEKKLQDVEKKDKEN